MFGKIISFGQGTMLHRLVFGNSIFSFATLIWIMACSKAIDYDNQFGPEYGEEWIYFVDANGTSNMLNFSSLPSDTRNMIFGDAYFHLYTRCNRDNPELLEVPKGGDSIQSKYFNASNEIKVVTHGWLSDDQADWILSIKEALLNKEYLNVITIDWSEISKNPLYPWPALSTKYVGKKLAKLLNALVRSYGVKGRSMHLIGHSLGAQVMGYAGSFFENRVNRITGLDPARPLFELPPMGNDYRLEKSDAEFVDIIHSCGGIYGYRKSHGHADYYPNNGKARQPGCEGAQTMFEACSHGRSHEYFAESIESDIGFRAYPCESWSKFDKGECRENPSYMGYPAANNSLGDYFLHTRSNPKYAMDE